MTDFDHPLYGHRVQILRWGYQYRYGLYSGTHLVMQSERTFLIEKEARKAGERFANQMGFKMTKKTIRKRKCL